MADDPQDEELSSDQKAAEKAAEQQRDAVTAALLSALLFLRPRMTPALYWMPQTWEEFRQIAGEAIDPAWTAFDKAAKAVWLGYDYTDVATLEQQRRYTEKFVNEFGENSRRAIEKAVQWGRERFLSDDDMTRILAHVAGLNGNQTGAVLAEWALLQESGASPDLLDRMLSDVAKKALKDRAGIVAGDVLWDAIQMGRLSGGMQEQLATNAPVMKRWKTAADEMVCPTCGALHGVETQMGTPFPGGYMHPRAHSHCRCWLEIIVPDVSGYEAAIFGPQSSAPDRRDYVGGIRLKGMF